MKDKSTAKKFLFLLVALCLLAIGIFRMRDIESSKPHEFTRIEGSVFHTVYHIQYDDPTDYTPELTELFREFDASVSMFNEQSLVSRINRGDTTVVADSYLHTLMRKAREVSEATHGAFDVTCAPLVNLWGFGFSNSESVTPELVDSIRSFVGYKLVSLDRRGHVVKVDSRVQLDFSSIAKGYMCDVVANFLRQRGISNYMVEIGGEIACGGLNAHSNLWGVGINEPIEDSTQLNNRLKEVMHLTDCGVATSGNYRNFYYKNGKRYAHTINPTTGYPVQSDVLSATVVAPTCMTADAYATAFMVLGSDESVRILEADTTLMGYLIVSRPDEEGNAVIYSPRLKHMLANPK